jgi:DNA repair protein RecO (recombination protein O)
MSRSYKATGIILKGMPMGETDRLVTILTIEHGLVRVIVPGARKHKSRLAGRSSQFVVNELFIVQGKSLGKLVQAETVRSFPGLSTDLARLTASQYLAELVLCQALKRTTPGRVVCAFDRAVAALRSQASSSDILACLSQGIFQLLRGGWGGPRATTMLPEPRRPLPLIWATLTGRWALARPRGALWRLTKWLRSPSGSPRAKTPRGRYAVSGGATRARSPQAPRHKFNLGLRTGMVAAVERARSPLLQRSLPGMTTAEQQLLGWQRIERLLRQYAEFHFDRPIRSATLIDACFPTPILPR